MGSRLLRVLTKPAGTNGRAVQVLNDREPEGAQIEGELRGIEEQAEGLTGAGNPLGKRIEGALLRLGHQFARNGIVEDHAAAGRQTCNEAKGREGGFAREIGYDTEPGEKRRLVVVESGCFQSMGERIALKVDGGKAQGVGDRNRGVQQALAFPGLRVGVIDFENAEVREGIAISECVEPRAKDHALPDTLANGNRELLFGKAAAHGQKQTQSADPRMLILVVGFFAGAGSGFVAENAEGERIFEDEGAIAKLVRRAAAGDPLGCPAAATVDHAGSGLGIIAVQSADLHAGFIHFYEEIVPGVGRVGLLRIEIE